MPRIRLIRKFIRRMIPRDLRDPKGLTVMEIIVALAIMAVALVAIWGLVGNAVTSFGVGEDFLDVQQNARQALEKFGEETRWTTRLISDAIFFNRSPSGTPPTACTGDLCAESVNLDIPSGNPVIPECAYYVRFSRDSATNNVRPGDQARSIAGWCVWDGRRAWRHDPTRSARTGQLRLGHQHDVLQLGGGLREPVDDGRAERGCPHQRRHHREQGQQRPATAAGRLV